MIVYRQFIRCALLIIIDKVTGFMLHLYMPLRGVNDVSGGQKDYPDRSFFYNGQLIYTKENK